MNNIRNSFSFPFIKQTGAMECGTTCLAIVLKFYGYPNIQQYLSEIGEITIEGTSLLQLSKLAIKFGFQSDCYELENVNYLYELKLPLIAHYEGNHFIVVYKVTKKKIYISDPAFGKHVMEISKFEKKWNGVVMELKPTENLFKNEELNLGAKNSLEIEKAVFKKFYFPVFKSLKIDFLEVLLGSFVLNLLGVVVPFLTQTIVDEVIPNQNKSLFFAILYALLINFVIRIIVLYIRNLLMVNLRVKFELEFFSNFFSHFLLLSQKFYDDRKREDFISRFQQNIRLREIVNPAILQQFFDFIFLFILIPFLFYLEKSIALLAVIYCFIYFLTLFFYTPRILHLAEKIMVNNYKVLGKFLDSLLGIKIVKLLGIEDYVFGKWRKEYMLSLNIVLKNEKTQAIVISLQQAIFYFGTLGVYWIGALKVFNHEISIGKYLAFTSLFMMIISSLSNFQYLWFNYVDLKVSLKKLNDILIQPTEFNSTQIELKQSISNIDISNLNFRYNVKESRNILNNINLKINSGSHIGIVGRNGSGKSTLVKLLVNLYNGFEGSILINGLDIKQILPSSLRKRVYLFPQDIYIFDGTLADNLRLAKQNATIDELITACKKADLFEFIKNHYFGFNLMLGNFGSVLSGGQVLKIGFARLFLTDPDVIILDEASSQLDLETEKLIMNNLYEHFSKKTIISIAHRIHTLKNVDKIIVLDNGTIIEQGNHDELTRLNGTYYSFLSNYINY